MLTQQVDLNNLLDQTIDEIEFLPSFEGITIMRDFEPDLASLQADPNQLKQVFINLLNNAAESIEDEGIIEVITRQVDPVWFEIKFSDTGCGIPRENLGKMFTPFFTTKGVGKGTGLGLSITYGIIKMHRGQISVDSELGIGSSFTIRLPIRSEPAETGSNSNSNLIG
jgi:two-component system NtrC family sensor kinase